MNYPRVTEIISPWSGLDKIPEATLQYAADRGTRVHSYCTRYAIGDFVVSVDADCRPYFDSFRRWFDSQVESVLLAEERFIHPLLNYTGQIDLYVILKSAESALVDIKTPVTSYPIWAMQLSAYRSLLAAHNHFPERIGSLQLSPEGKTPRMKWYQDSAMDLNAFMSALNVHNYITK